MSHLQPLTVSWYYGAVGVGVNLKSLHVEVATASLSCPLQPCLLPAQHGLRRLGGCSLRPPRAGGP